MRSLDRLERGQCAIVKSLSAAGPLRRRLQDMGFVEGERVECINISPLGDPRAYLIRGAVVALRKEDSATIDICPMRREERGK